MALTKKDIIEKVRNRMEYTPKKSKYYRPYDSCTYRALNKKQCRNAVENLVEIIKSSLERGEDVLFSGFGKFSVKKKRSRRGRNPSTGESMQLKARRVVSFSCSAKLRDTINKI